MELSWLSSNAYRISNGLLVMNSVVTSLSSVAPCSMSIPFREPYKAAWPNVPACVFKVPSKARRSPGRSCGGRARSSGVHSDGCCLVVTLEVGLEVGSEMTVPRHLPGRARTHAAPMASPRSAPLVAFEGYGT